MTRHTYQTRLPPLPRVASRAAAQAYVQAIDTLLAEAQWTINERAGLRRLRAKWRRRAQGHDRRWLLVGSRSGRLRLATELRLHQGDRGQAKGTYDD